MGTGGHGGGQRGGEPAARSSSPSARLRNRIRLLRIMFPSSQLYRFEIPVVLIIYTASPLGGRSGGDGEEASAMIVTVRLRPGK